MPKSLERKSVVIHRLAISVFFFLQGSVFATWTARIPDVKINFNLNDASLGTVLLFFPLGQFLCLPVAGYLVERFGSRKTLLSAALLYPALLCVVGLCGSVYSLSAMVFFLGAMANLHNLSTNTQAVAVERIYGKNIMSSFHGMWSIAGFVAGLVSSFLVAKNIGALPHFCMLLGFGILVIAFFGRSTMAEDIREGAEPNGGGATCGEGEACGGREAAGAGEPNDGGSAQKATLNVFKGMDSSLVVLGILSFCAMLCEGCIYDWGALYFMDEIRVEDKFIRFGYTGCMLAMSAMRFVADFVVNRIGKRRTLLLCGLIAATGFFMAVGFPYFICGVLGFTMVGLGLASVVPICYSMASYSQRMSAGRAINAVSTIGFSGLMLGPPLIGYLAEMLGLRAAFLFVGILSLLIVLLSRKKFLYLPRGVK